MRTLFVLLLMSTALALAQPIQVVTEPASRVQIVNGKPTGPTTEVVEATLKQAGLHDYRLEVLPWARAYQVALRQSNTLIYPIVRSPAREGQFKWVGQLQKIRFYFFKRADRSDIVVKQLDDAKPYTIGVVRGDICQTYLEGAGFKKLLLAAKWNDNISRVLNRQLDMVVLGEYDFVPYCAANSAACAALEQVQQVENLSDTLYMAFSVQTDDAIVARARLAFEQLKGDGTIDRLLAPRR